MQLSVWVKSGATWTDVSDVAAFEDTEIRRDSTEAISTASCAFEVDSQSSTYGTAVYGQGRYAFRPRPWQEISIRDQSGTAQFAGYVLGVKPVSPPGGPTRFECDCADYGTLLDRIIVNRTYPAGWTDKNIILDAFAGVTDVTVLAANISNLATLDGAFDAKDVSLREIIDQVCGLTGGNWRVDYSRNLQYYAPGTVGLPFTITDAGSGNHRMEEIEDDSTALANRITVLGGFDELAAEITATESSLESQGRYGIRSATVVDRSITDPAIARLRARAELAERALPRRSGRFVTWSDGIDVGQSVLVNNRAYSLNGVYVVYRVTTRQFSKSFSGADVPGEIYCEHEVEFGQRKPELIAELARALQRPKQPTYEPIARPAPGSVGVENFASTIEPVRIVNALPSLPNSAYSDNAVVLLTTDRKLYRRSGNTWTRNVNAVDIEDQLQAGQLAADSVIAGTVAAGAIRAIDGAFELAAIQSADINTLTASKLTAGTIDASVITVTNLNASNITLGTMSGTRLSDGTVADIKIASGLSATKMTTGTLDATLVNVVNLNAGNITVGTMSGSRLQDGTVGDIKIASGLSATKLTTGTLDASVVNVVNINAGNITAGTMSVTRLSSGTMTVSGTTITMDVFGIALSGLASFRPGSSTYGPTAATIAGYCDVSSTYRVNGTPVVGARQSTVNDVVLIPFGTATFTQGHENCMNALITAVNAIIDRLQAHGLIS